jgi:L-lactate dehydrogenase complex protein LldF
MDKFRQKIQAAIKDQALQTALDRNASQRWVARENAYLDLRESFEELKRKAHKVRSEAILNLDRYLSEFTSNAAMNGFIVHGPVDAAEARNIVLEISQQHQARLITKSKTMMSEEIQLNPILDFEGIEVVETDLGEYIVQLREEHPSHIITPAVHLRREDVGKTFHEKLGIPFTDDIQTLTNTARSRLRHKFLNSDIGISGVNMGVASTGTICIVTNEGNGRMVTTLPRVHIALMGIERIVSDMEELDLILKLLPRSATGQKTTVYTQLIKGPRLSNELDGAEERHLILIDNGRTRLSQSPLAESLFCIRCGACINACPVFREIGGFAYTSSDGDYTPYPGPIGSVLSPGLFGQREFGHLAQASTLCGACKEACPMDIDLPAMLLRVRSGGENAALQRKNRSNPEGISFLIAWGLRLFTWATTRPGLYSNAQKLAALIGKIGSPKSSWMALPSFTGWGFSKDLPRPVAKTFKERWGEINQNRKEIKKTARIQAVESKNPVPISHGAISLLRRFESELIALDTNFIPCSAQDLADKILTLLREKEITQILSWADSHLPDGLLNHLNDNGISTFFTPDPEIKVGLTGIDAAIADTGSIMLTSGAGKPLTTSLLPEIHIAVVRESDLYENLGQVLSLQEIQRASSAVFISGPSRTADIEMTLTIGVHGPGELYVFCIRNQE